MLVYEKTAEGERHLFGTLGNIPTDEDLRLSYTDETGVEIDTPALNGKYFDDGKGGIKDEDGNAICVFIDDVNIIPGGVEKQEATTQEDDEEEDTGKDLDEMHDEI